ncbi:ATP-grasp domain-containing protein [Hymenobacter rubidus]|uniref:ATP-grasp domain-containing protein n=1 Tax=Hymenobacter rubidus TaxID=1441626 RepID=UPI00191DAD5E|nr:ATP-grasp domain-containing protein [Hymenobacter rubidus]
MDGFQQMGWEIVPYTDADPVRDHLPDEVVVGHIAAVRASLRSLGFDIPAELGYPAALLPFLGRRLWQSTINTVAANPESWPVFVKPILDTKKFTGVLVRRIGDLIGCGDQYEDTPIWCAEPIELVAEWRCFVRYGQILDVRPYRGDWRAHFDPAVVELALAAYLPEAPAAFALDIGRTAKGQTVVVEVNEGYALGAYGLTSLAYAKFLSARWAELTGSEDYCRF